MMKTIYFLRHAETVMNKEAMLIGGRSVMTTLTEEGLNQARRLGEYLKSHDISFDEIYSSDTVRTKHTAQIVGRHCGFEADDLVLREELHELHQGDWEGMPRSEMYTADVMKAISSDNHNFKAPNGESQKDVEIRIMKLINELISKAGTKTIGIFTHGFTIRCFLRHILDSDPRMSFRITIDNTSITKVTYDGDSFRIDKINSTPHLE